VKFSLGINKVATASVDFTLGRRNGVNFAQRSDYYDDILEEAKNIPVIIHGTSDLRAVQSDGEELILQILLHQECRGRFSDENQTWAIIPCDPFRRITKVRHALLQNALLILREPYLAKGSGRAKVLFKEEAVRLYNRLDALQANLYPEDGSLFKLAVPSFGRVVHGWEYMDLVKNKDKFDPKRIELRKTCGGWHKYARDIQALPLFVENCGDILQPARPGAICNAFQSIPKGECYLGVRAEALLDLFDDQGCIASQESLTKSGLTLLGAPNIFEPCSGSQNSRKACTCKLTNRIVSKKKLSKQFKARNLKPEGAIIIGHKVDDQISMSLIPDEDQMINDNGDHLTLKVASTDNDYGGLSGISDDHEPMFQPVVTREPSPRADLNFRNVGIPVGPNLTHFQSRIEKVSDTSSGSGKDLHSRSSSNTPFQASSLDDHDLEKSNSEDSEIARIQLTRKSEHLEREDTLLYGKDFSSTPERGSKPPTLLTVKGGTHTTIVAHSSQIKTRTDHHLQVDIDTSSALLLGNGVTTPLDPGGMSRSELVLPRRLRKKSNFYGGR
jgi:hypothetical protein